MGDGRRAGSSIEHRRFPELLDPAILGDILAGGADKVKEAGAVLVGGHSVQDDEQNTVSAYPDLFTRIRSLRIMAADLAIY